MQLKEEISSLDEVVVIGYGSQDRKYISTSISSVTGQEIENLPVPSFDQALSGRVPGLSITQNAGTPGARSTIRIRGTASVSGSNEPLIVVDGIPILSNNAIDNSSSSMVNSNGGALPLNFLSTINANDIASIEVLKDAASTSIYGSRAANGVILITTKRGKEGASAFSVNYYTGINQFSKQMDVLNSQQYITLINEINTNAGADPLYDPDVTYPNTQWQDEILRTGSVNNVEVAASGGSEKTSFYLSGGYFRQKGVILNSDMDRINVRMNADHKMRDNFRIGTSLSGSRSNFNSVGETRAYSTIKEAIHFNPVIPVYDSEGNYGTDPYLKLNDANNFRDRANPVALIREQDIKNTSVRVLGNVYAEFNIIPSLTLKSNLGVDLVTNNSDLFVSNRVIGVYGQTSMAKTANSKSTSWINENVLSFNKKFAGLHDVSAVAGVSMQEAYQNNMNAGTRGFASDLVKTIGGGGTITEVGGTKESWGIISYFGRLGYIFNSKLMATGSFRIDGSSRFGQGKKFDYFPSVSLGYRLSQESFMDGLPFVNEAKIRLSYGITGNQEGFGNYRARGRVSTGANYLGLPGVSVTEPPNPDLTWERTTQWNVGVDLGLFKNRIGIIADYYVRDTEGLLFAVSLPQYTGFRSSSVQNSGNVRNQGIELSLNTENLTGGLTWSTQINFTYNRNEVLELPVEQLYAGGINVMTTLPTSYTTITTEGEAVGSFYGYVVNGIFQNQEEITRLNASSPSGLYQSEATSPGDIRFRDINNDGVVNDQDRTILGSGLPKFFGGFGNTWSYRNFELNVFFQYVWGNDIYNFNRTYLEGMSNFFNASTVVLDRWTLSNTDTEIPRAVRADPNNNTRVSDRWIEDGSFLRLKSLTLSYNLKSKFFNNVQIYFTGYNLLTFTSYSGLDPEVNALSDDTSVGIDWGTYPQSRTYLAGVNIKF